jgi:hypothetical protein
VKKVTIALLLLATTNIYADELKRQNPMEVGKQVIALATKVNNIVCINKQNYNFSDYERKLIYDSSHDTFLSMVEQCASQYSVSSNDRYIWVYKLNNIKDVYLSANLSNYSIHFLQ